MNNMNNMDNRISAQNVAKKLKETMVGGLYRHFKGNVYEVIDIGVHSEEEDCMVIYRSVDKPEYTWCRPLSMFLSEVDHKKYPEVKQLMRFERLGENK